jgi:transcription elongation factor Elf1
MSITLPQIPLAFKRKLNNPLSTLKHSLNNLSPCPHCGSSETPRTGAGRKPQEASLHCAECKRFLRWIAAGELSGKGKGGERDA